MAWELQVTRLGLQRHAASDQPVRTYGTYKVVIGGNEVPGLSGHICERIGPGDNTSHGVHNHVRIREGRYALSTHFNRYKSVDFSADQSHPPAFLLLGTGDRTFILVHPAHDPHLYLSSIGCFNPTQPLDADDEMEFDESRARVIALLDSLKEHDPDAFASDGDTKIKDAFMVITGEPMGPVPPVA
jgi:hypothetical protein